MTEPVPWLVLAGLGAFHGLNPAMGWLFAVALGLHRRERRIVWLAPLPIALGHALSIGMVAAVFLAADTAVNPNTVRIAAAFALIGWALYHWRFGHRHRVRFGMKVGLVALTAWSFLMATAHGAGLMLWPALMPLCRSASVGADGALSLALTGMVLHTASLLVVSTGIAIAVYEWVGVGVLRQAWINLDIIWTLTLAAAGMLVLLG